MALLKLTSLNNQRFTSLRGEEKILPPSLISYAFRCLFLILVLGFTSCQTVLPVILNINLKARYNNRLDAYLAVNELAKKHDISFIQVFSRSHEQLLIQSNNWTDSKNAQLYNSAGLRIQLSPLEYNICEQLPERVLTTKKLDVANFKVDSFFTLSMLSEDFIDQYGSAVIIPDVTRFDFIVVMNYNNIVEGRQNRRIRAIKKNFKNYKLGFILINDNIYYPSTGDFFQKKIGGE